MSRQTLHNKIQEWSVNGVAITFGSSQVKGTIPITVQIGGDSEVDGHVPIGFLKETPFCLTVEKIIDRLRAKQTKGRPVINNG